MKITDLSTFTAEVEILGTPHMVEVEEDTYVDNGVSKESRKITIHDVTMKEVAQILAKLSPDEAEQQAQAASDVTPISTAKKGRGTKSSAQPAEASAKEPATSPPPPTTPKEEPAQQELPQVAAETQQATPPASPPAATPDKPVNGANGLPEDVVNATKMRDLLIYLHEKGGCKTKEQLIAKCKEIQPHVVLLQRVGSNLEERVTRAIEVLGLGA